MHGLTVYGIETLRNNELLINHGCCMHGLTVYGIETQETRRLELYLLRCMHGLTVYGIETRASDAEESPQPALHAWPYRLRYKITPDI